MSIVSYPILCMLLQKSGDGVFVTDWCLTPRKASGWMICVKHYETPVSWCLIIRCFLITDSFDET